MNLNLTIWFSILSGIISFNAQGQDLIIHFSKVQDYCYPLQYTHNEAVSGNKIQYLDAGETKTCYSLDLRKGILLNETEGQEVRVIPILFNNWATDPFKAFYINYLDSSIIELTITDHDTASSHKAMILRWKEGDCFRGLYMPDAMVEFLFDNRAQEEKATLFKK
jgi:hypothetical protein